MNIDSQINVKDKSIKQHLPQKQITSDTNTFTSELRSLKQEKEKCVDENNDIKTDVKEIENNNNITTDSTHLENDSKKVSEKKTNNPEYQQQETNNIQQDVHNTNKNDAEENTTDTKQKDDTTSDLKQPVINFDKQIFQNDKETELQTFIPEEQPQGTLEIETTTEQKIISDTEIDEVITEDTELMSATDDETQSIAPHEDEHIDITKDDVVNVEQIVTKTLIPEKNTIQEQPIEQFVTKPEIQISDKETVKHPDKAENTEFENNPVEFVIDEPDKMSKQNNDSTINIEKTLSEPKEVNIIDDVKEDIVTKKEENPQVINQKDNFTPQNEIKKPIENTKDNSIPQEEVTEQVIKPEDNFIPPKEAMKPVENQKEEIIPQKETKKIINTENNIVFEQDDKNLQISDEEQNSKDRTKIDKNITDNDINKAVNNLQDIFDEFKKVHQKEESKDPIVKDTKKYDDKNKKRKDSILIDNNMNIQEPKDAINMQMGTNMQFNSNGQPFAEFVNSKTEKEVLKSTEKELKEEKAILSTLEENIAIANKNMMLSKEDENTTNTPKTKIVTNEQGIKKVDTKTSITVDTIVKYDTIIMDKADADFFINLVNDGMVDINDVKNPDKSSQISKTLADLISKAMENNKPIRIDFDNDISVIIKINRAGKISADFLPSTQIAENYLKENLPLLKQRFDDNNIDYDELNQRKQKQDTQDNRKKGRKDE